ncbi:MAG: BON domain-containing protein [Deltaproteobacteria bacterium]|nr:BON domain-containing protein [Deltaproteobacteria bacterium]
MEWILLVISLSLSLILALPERTDATDMEKDNAPKANLSPGVVLTPGKAHRPGPLLPGESMPTQKEGNSGGLRDDELARKIREEILTDPFIESSHIQVSVEDGVATLRGTVRSWTEHAAATADAFQSGAKEVKNQLQVIEQTLVAGHRE